jgi:hypothetical protein
MVYSELVFTKHVTQDMPKELRQGDFPIDPNAEDSMFDSSGYNYSAWDDARDEWRKVMKLPMVYNFGVALVDVIFDTLLLVAVVATVGLGYVTHREHEKGDSAVAKRVSELVLPSGS